MSALFPSKLQFLFQPKRYKVAHGGRGSGKSWGFARALLVLAAQSPMRILCAREVQKSIKDSVYRLLCDQIEALHLGAFYETLEAEIRGKNGSVFLFSGLADHTAESIKSFEGLSVAWVEEAQTVSKRSWDILVPTLRTDFTGEPSEIWVTFNPLMDTDETWLRFVQYPPEDAVVVQMNWSDNPWFPDVLEKARQDTLRRDPDTYDNMWEGKPKSVADGAIYAREMQRAYFDKRIGRVPYDPLLPVHTVWDLGWNDSMAIGMFQRLHGELRLIDYIEDDHRTLDWYVAQLEKRDFRWGRDFLPHDARQANIQTGTSSETALRKLGRRPFVLPVTRIEEGIKATRLMFPRLYIDAVKCATLVEHLKRYSRAVHKVTGEDLGPLHDEHSHGADMMRMAALAVEKMDSQFEAPRGAVETFEPNYAT